MSQTQTEHEQQFATPQEALAHFGVKGMKWGVRKSDSGGGSGGGGERGKIRRGLTKANVATDAGAKIIREGEKKLIFLPHANRQQAAQRTQTRMLSAARRVNKDPQFKGKDIKNNAELKSKYFEKLKEEAKTIYAEELNISRTEAWGQFLNVDTSATTQQMRINAAVDRIKHADDENVETLMVMDFVTDDLGHVIDIKVPNKYLKHELFDDNEFTLMHYGKKGMKWGVRNDKDAGTSNSRSAAKAELRETGTKARDIIRESRRSPDKAGREAAAKKYEAEVLAKVKTPEFKAAFEKANTMGKGEMAAHVLIAGPLAALTIPVAKMSYAQIRKEGYDLEVDIAHDVLREMRS